MLPELLGGATGNSYLHKGLSVGEGLDSWQWGGILLTWVYYGNTIGTWLVALSITVTAYLFLGLLRRVVFVRLQELAKRTSTQLDNILADVLGRTGWWFTTYLSVYVGSQSLELRTETGKLLHSLLVIALALQVAIWGHHLLTHWLAYYFQQKHANDQAMQTMIGALAFLGRLGLFSILLLMVLQNLGFKIDTLLTGLGIGGIAVALAVQSILGDLFASLSIVLDRPFLVGDFIILDDGMMGTVAHVGLKTTRLTSFTGEELIIANNDLLKARLRNYRQMKDRLVNFTVRVSYKTSHDKLKQIPLIIKEVIDNNARTAFEWANLAAYGASTLDFDVAYYVKGYEWYCFMDIREEIYLEVLRRFAEEGIEFAYPAQRLYVEGGPQ